ncbi:hypothetical protein LJR290_004680 [Variovorax sp. LjRoot290]|uniref:hypothetical protein n=1 Tax=unclassified Variovorax TaxID=663243 RepID=UPI003ECC5606
MTNDASKKIRVGIIGASPVRGWAAQAHIPALKSLADDFEITALSTSQRGSADAAGRLFGVSVPRASSRYVRTDRHHAIPAVRGGPRA